MFCYNLMQARDPKKVVRVNRENASDYYLKHYRNEKILLSIAKLSRQGNKFVEAATAELEISVARQKQDYWVKVEYFDPDYVRSHIETVLSKVCFDLVAQAYLTAT